MLPDILFQEIRGHGPVGSKADGFEELATQLLEDTVVSWPEGTRFERFGNPDGGREGRAILPSGETWAWQAKYVFRLDSSAYAQIDRSVRRAITREPRLRKYFIVCPYDLPAGDTETARSAHTTWRQHVSKWRAEAERASLQVEFDYVGLHQLVKALTRPENAGRLRYWFDTAWLTPDWFAAIISRAVANAGPRYTPELHVGLPISEVFDSFARTNDFEHVLRTLLGNIRSARRYGFRAPEGQAEHFESLIRRSEAALDELDSVLGLAVEVARGVRPLPDPREAVANAEEGLVDLERQLYARCLPEGRDYFVGDAAMLYTMVRRIAAAVVETGRFVHGTPWTAAERGVLLLTGDAGTGKTHLMCDVAERRTRRGLPTVILLGEEFDGRAPSTQLTELLGFNGPPDEFLAALDAAAEAGEDVGLIMIDALNEGEDPAMWGRSLAGFVQDIARYRHLKLAVSCRTQFVDPVVPQAVANSAARVIHRGFAEAPDAALARYLDAYGIERPSFPMLEPEFTNPLFLKLVCTTLHDRGATQFPRERVAFTWLYDAYIEAVDARLSAASRYDYDPRDHLARRAVQAIAAEMVTSGPSVRRKRARELVDALLPGRTWARSLLKGLLDEGVLAGSIHRDEDSIHFGYQRLGDVAVSTMISELPRDRALEEVRRLASRWWRNAGWLESLAVTLPEAQGMELVDVVRAENTEVIDQAPLGLVSSLAWRTRESVSERTVELVRGLLADAELREDTYAALVQLATLPSHPLNADWLHEELLRMPLADRDTSWTVFCNGDRSERRPAGMLIDWAWSDSSVDADDEVRRLAAVSLAWFLASSSRPVRDTATKAMVHLLEGHADVLTSVLRAFFRVNDPYVTERLLAAACGVALRSHEADERVAVGSAVAEVTVLAGRWPEDLLARDYARRAIHAAAASGWDPAQEILSTVDPPYDSEWPVTARTEQEIMSLSSPPEYRYGSLRSSLFTLGDFRHYVIDPRVGRFAGLEKAGAASLVARRVFDRVLELGWTPERFDWYDRRRNWEPSSGQTIERIGKKYQWIALHETLGRLADREKVGGRYTDDPRRPYADPGDIGARDIDPTVTIRESRHAGWSDSPITWFSPAQADFVPEPFDEWMRETAGLPDPLALIVPTDERGNPWLTMEGHYQWSEEQKPDEEAMERTYRRVWYQIRSYLLRGPDAEAIETWAAGQDWAGRWMPESAEFHGVLLADHPHHPSWRLKGDGDFWDRQEPPGRLEVTTAWYAGSGTAYDQSNPNPASGLLPSQALFDLLELRRVGDFEWIDRSREVVAADAAVRQFGPASLLVRGDNLVRAADDAAVGLLWTVLGEKQLVTSDPTGGPEDEREWLEFSATYVLAKDRVRRVGSVARLRRAGVASTGAVRWQLQDQRRAT